MTAWTMERSPRPDNVPPELEVDWDIYNPPSGYGDVYMALKSLHAGPDIVWTPRNGGHWIPTRFEDIDFIQRNHDPFSMENVQVPRHPEPRLIPLETDPPMHPRYRAIVSPWFTPKSIESLGGFTRDLAIELIEGFRARGECEFITEFALVLPIAIFCKLSEVPWEDRLKLLEWTQGATRGGPEAMRQSFGKMVEYVGHLIAERHVRPGKDLLSEVVRAKDDGRPLTPEETLGMVTQLLFGGLDTVASSMGFVAWYLANHPAHRQQLIDDPALIPKAVEEFLRRFPVSSTCRTLTRDFHMKGVHLRKGDRLLVINALANLDDRKFERPVDVDFHRPNMIHAGFGAGPHRCPGSFLARTEIRIFLEEWLKRIPEFRIKPGEQPVFSSGMVNALLRLALSWGNH